MTKQDRHPIQDVYDSYSSYVGEYWNIINATRRLDTKIGQMIEHYEQRIKNLAGWNKANKDSMEMIMNNRVEAIKRRMFQH